MLSKVTVQILHTIASIADEAYQEGGMTYTYSFGHRCAHYELPKMLEHSHTKEERQVLKKNGLTEHCELFIDSAMGNPFSSFAHDNAKYFSKQLLDSLAHDFSHLQSPSLFIENGKYSQSLYLIYTEDNDFHALHLFWSID